MEFLRKISFQIPRQNMWQARTKNDLIIEVWEKLDCESIGAREIEAIIVAVKERFGVGAVNTPMSIARLLADEGAELRHAEILKLDVERRLDSPFDAMFRNLLKTDDFKQAKTTLRQLENLRRKFTNDNEREGLRLVRETAKKGKERAIAASLDKKLAPKLRVERAEIADWFTLWMQTPELFENWVTLRENSREFRERFGLTESTESS